MTRPTMSRFAGGGRILDWTGRPIERPVNARWRGIGRYGERRWQGTDTNRLTAAHWTPADGQSINQWLSSYGDILRNRCEYEARTNPIVEGIVNTWVDDLVGPLGPVLQVQSDSEVYDEALQALWAEWWAMPDVAGQMAGPDLLSLWVRTKIVPGEYLVQITTDRGSKSAVRARLQTIHPRRLATPPAYLVNGDVVLGVMRRPDGRPVRYFVADEMQQADGVIQLGTHTGLKAEDVIHDFKPLEPGQARGVSWLASALQDCADLRDYDTQVLDAARAAAHWAIVLTSNHPEATFQPIADDDSVVEIERSMMNALPAGWDAKQMQPQQPSTQYVEYRKERQRDMGRAFSMPLMLIRLDAGNHNYSSARFDGQNYAVALAREQRAIERRCLNRLVGVVAREGMLTGALPAAVHPMRYVWTWPVRPHVDPQKEAKALETQMGLGVLAPSDAVAGLGRDFEATMAKWKRDIEAGDAAGIDLRPKRTAGRDAGELGDVENRHEGTEARRHEEAVGAGAHWERWP